MAVIEFPGNPEPSRIEIGEGTVLWLPEHPREDEGVLVLEQTPLPDFTHLEVNTARTTELRRRPDMDTSFGKYWERQVVMSDDARFPEFIGIAQNPTDGSIIHSVPAWFESPSQGLLKKENDKLHAQGIHTWTTGIPVNRSLSLARTAFNIHASLTEHAQDMAYDFSTDVIQVRGKSNGAMTETGVMAYAPQFERIVEDGFLMDPALVQKLGFEDIKKFLMHPDYPLREVYCLGKQAIRLAVDPHESVIEAARTIEFSAEYALGNLLLTKTLFGGDLGLLLAHVPEEQHAHYRLLAHSISNQKKVFKRILRGSSRQARSDVTYDQPMGTHISIINPRHTRDMLDYFAR